MANSLKPAAHCLVSILMLSLAVFFSIGAPQALAQTTPDKAIRLVIPYSPGGSVDVVGRGLAKRYSDLTGRTVVVENKPGAGGAIATSDVVRADKDGHTLLLHTGTITVEKAAGKKVPYELTRDLSPVTLVADGPFALAVNNHLPVKNYSELIEHAKANPGKLNYSSAGVGTSTHLAMELFKELAGVDILHVPYKGGAPSLNAVAAGEVHMSFSPLVNVRPLGESGRLHVLATSTQSRTDLWPELPSSLESGLPEYSSSVWYGLFTPVGVPEKAESQLVEDFRHLIHDPETRQWLRTQGLVAIGSTPAEFNKRLNDEITQLQSMMQRTGIKID